MMVGLQGSGKTTTMAKIARRLTERGNKKVLMASLDVNRPAAQEQLAVLGEQAGVATRPIVPGQQPVDIARRALQAAKLQGFDVVMLDTAGRLHVDQALMDEMRTVSAASNPAETLLVVDSLTGSRRFIPSVWPAAYWAWAMSYRWSNAPRNRSRRKTPRRWRRSSPRGSSTSTTCAIS